MATLTWLHLSDLHAGRPLWDSRRVTATLVADLKRLAAQGLQPDLLFFTGDAAFGRAGGAPLESLDRQFDLAAELLTAARKAFAQEIPLSHTFLVPGNHDIDRTEVLESQTETLDRLSLDQVIHWIDSANLEWRTALARLDAYRRFLERHGFQHLLADPARLIYGAVREVAGVRVGIAGFNSAWSCCRNGEKGKLWMGGRWQQGTLREAIRGADLAIALVHHPTSWLVEQETPAFGRGLRQDFRFLLHGHEHREWIEPPEGGGFVTVAAGACYEGSAETNGYNLVRLDLAKGQGEVWLRRFDDGGGGWVKRPVAGWAEDGIWRLELPWLARDGKAAPAAGAGGAPVDGRAPDREAGGEPSRAPAPRPSPQLSRESLRKELTEQFSRAELKAILYDLQIDWDELPGEAKGERVIELLLRFERRNEVERLLATVERHRPGFRSGLSARR